MCININLLIIEIEIFIFGIMYNVFFKLMINYLKKIFRKYLKLINIFFYLCENRFFICNVKSVVL